MGAPVIEWIRDGVGFTPAAAASFRRAEASWYRKSGRPRIDCNSSYRDYGLQLSMYQAWTAWVEGRGPRPNHSRALHPDQSVHCRAEALDSDDWTLPGFIAHMEDHGWIRTAASDPTERHHFEYQWWRDNHRDEPAPAGVEAQLFAAVVAEEENDMRIIAGPGGAQKFVDELGADDIGNYFYVSPDFSWTENILASWKLTGVDHEKGETPESATNWKEYELVRHIAQKRWDQKRAQIVADTVAALTPVLQLLTPQIDDAVVEAAIEKAVANLAPTATISDQDKADIAKATVDLQAKRLGS